MQSLPDLRPASPRPARRSPLLVLSVAASLLLAGPGAADPNVPGRAAGISVLGGATYGVGPDFRAEFTGGGVRFVPALGNRAEVPRWVELTLESVSRGGTEVLRPSAQREPWAEGATVEYREAGFVERYEVRPEGVEQSFVFEALPPGAGDLVVRLDVATNLPLASADSEAGVLLAAEGLGGVRIGGVTGIDAEGREVSGWIRVADGTLELGLPASFVDGAALPLVLDPLLGTETFVAGGTLDAAACDVAVMTSGSPLTLGPTYLVVWEERFSAITADIVAQRLNGAGALVGGPILLATGGEHQNPAVGGLDVGPRFVVAWEVVTGGVTGIDVETCFVELDGTASASLKVASSLADDVDPDVSLNEFFGQIVWNEEGAGIPGVCVLADVNGDPIITHVMVVTSDPGASQPALTNSRGSDYEPMCVWHLDDPLEQSIRGRRWRGATPDLGEVEFEVFRGATLQELSAPDVAATEEDDYYVVWTAEGNGLDVLGRRVILKDGETPTTGPIDELAVGGGDQREPAIAALPGQYMVAFQQGAAGAYQVDAIAIDPMTGAELEYLNDLASGDVPNPPAIAGGPALGPPYGNDGMVAMTELQLDFPFDTDVVAQRVEAMAGTVTPDTGTGCGSGGVARASAANAGNATFRSELWGAEAGRPALLAVSLSGLSLPLGAGTLVVDPTQLALTSVLLTDAAGYAGLTTGIPAGLAGLSLWEQWFVLASAAPCTPFGVDFSDALSFTIE